MVVTPVFAASYSGLFKMFFDVLEPGPLAGTPVLLAATAGTARHSLVLDHALRPLFSHLRAVVVPTGVFAASEDFGAPTRASSTSGSTRRGRARRAHGRRRGPAGPTPFTRRAASVEEQLEDPTPFDELLRRATGACPTLWAGQRFPEVSGGSVLVGAVEDRPARRS